MNPKISIIILNFRQKEFCDTCIQHILNFPVRVPYEIIVVDNASNDDSLPVLKKKWGHTSNILFVENEKNEGFGMGHNLAIRRARGEYIAIMNPDIEVHENTLNSLYDYISSHSDCGLVAPQLIYPDGTIQDSYRTFPTLWDLLVKRTILRNIFQSKMSHYLMYNFDPQKTHDVDWIVGAFLMISKKFFDELRGFDPRFFLFLEDTDLCRRVWEKDLRVVYYPKAKANHHHQRLSGNGFIKALRKKTFWFHMASALKYFWKWKGKRVMRLKESKVS